MNSSLIGKIDKARRYAKERDRVSFQHFQVHFRGDNDEHTISLDGDRWHCTCRFFDGWNVCSHTMALEKMLEGMLPAAAQNQSTTLQSAVPA